MSRYFREERIRLPDDFEIASDLYKGRKAERARAYLEELVNQIHIPGVEVSDGVIALYGLYPDPSTGRPNCLLMARNGSTWGIGDIGNPLPSAFRYPTLAAVVEDDIHDGDWLFLGYVPTLAEQLALEE